MKAWYFHFEGHFDEMALNRGDGLFSSCLVPIASYQKAKSAFLNALTTNSIILVDLIESFPIDGESLDPADPENHFWIDWYKKAVDEEGPVFDTWHLFERG